MDKALTKKPSAPVLLGVITARSGSKGIKNKNLRLVLGKPLISYTIKDALGYRGLYKTIITTDGPARKDPAVVGDVEERRRILPAGEIAFENQAGEAGFSCLQHIEVRISTTPGYGHDQVRFLPPENFHHVLDLALLAERTRRVQEDDSVDLYGINLFTSIKSVF